MIICQYFAKLELIFIFCLNFEVVGGWWIFAQRISDDTSYGKIEVCDANKDDGVTGDCYAAAQLISVSPTALEQTRNTVPKVQ